MKIKTFSKKNYVPEISGIPSAESAYLFTDHSQIPGAGKGLFTAVKIYKHEIIGIFKGRVLSDKEAKQKMKHHEDAYFINMIDGSMMDCKHSRCLAKYANDASGIHHSKHKNNAFITLNPDEEVCLVAKTDIAPGTEILCSYGKKYWDHFKKKFPSGKYRGD